MDNKKAQCYCQTGEVFKMADTLDAHYDANELVISYDAYSCDSSFEGRERVCYCHLCGRKLKGSVFQDAKFGDKFETRNGTTAVFIRHMDSFTREGRRRVKMILDGADHAQVWKYDGIAEDDQTQWDVVKKL